MATSNQDGNRRGAATLLSRVSKSWVFVPLRVAVASLTLLAPAIVASATLTPAELEQIKAVKAALPPPQPPPDPKTISVKLFPEGENRDLTIKTCAVCHQPELVVANKHTVDEWDNIIAKMVA
jgi:cytochrome c5